MESGDSSSGSSWQLYVTTMYLEPLLHYHPVSSSGVVVILVHLKKVLFLGLAVTEININFEINIKKV